MCLSQVSLALPHREFPLGPWLTERPFSRSLQVSWQRRKDGANHMLSLTVSSFHQQHKSDGILPRGGGGQKEKHTRERQQIFLIIIQSTTYFFSEDPFPTNILPVVFVHCFFFLPVLQMVEHLSRVFLELSSFQLNWLQFLHQRAPDIYLMVSPNILSGAYSAVSDHLLRKLLVCSSKEGIPSHILLQDMGFGYHRTFQTKQKKLSLNDTLFNSSSYFSSAQTLNLFTDFQVPWLLFVRI